MVCTWICCSWFVTFPLASPPWSKLYIAMMFGFSLWDEWPYHIYHVLNHDTRGLSDFELQQCFVAVAYNSIYIYICKLYLYFVIVDSPWAVDHLLEYKSSPNGPFCRIELATPMNQHESTSVSESGVDIIFAGSSAPQDSICLISFRRNLWHVRNHNHWPNDLPETCPFKPSTMSENSM